MEIINECNAPESFADTIYEAIDKSRQILNEFGLTGMPVSDVYITDEKKPADLNIPDEYKNFNFIVRLEMIMAKIKHIKYCYDIKQCYDLINEIFNYINIMLDISGRTELYITEKQRLKAKDSIIAHIRKILDTNYGDIETDIKLNEILEDIIEAERIYLLLHIASEALGRFDYNENRIYICYKTIRDNFKEKHLTDEYGGYIFAHEFFHAFHYQQIIGCVDEDGNQSNISYPALVRCSTVKESLAEYFAFIYARKHTGPQIIKKTEMYRIPAWGYAGDEIFKNYQTPSKNALFNAVYYLSLVDMERAYRLLCDYIK